MNSLYKRITTLGMVSVTAVLAWIYCVLEYRDEPIYIIGISLVLIISVYALLNAIISLRIDKDNKLKNHIDSTIANAIAGMEQSKSLEDMERLSKAMYIQLRKVNTTLSASSEDSSSKLNEEMNQTVVEAINKAVKIIVKYNQNNHEGMVLALSDLSTELSKISEELNQVKLQDNTDNSFNADFTNNIYGNESLDTDNGTVIPFPNDSNNESVNNDTTTSVNNTYDFGIPKTEESPASEAPGLDENRTLTPDEIAALFASAMGDNSKN